MGDWRYDVDRETNRLYVDLSGEMTVEDSKASNEALYEALADLEPGFTVVTDIRGIVPADDEVLEFLEAGKQAIAEHGAAAAVRVEPESTVAEMQFDRVGEDEEGYPVAKAESVEMADELLDQRATRQA